MNEARDSYRPEIDGLRAVCVVAVILYHLGWDTVGSGFLGVDMFFVISGFVITKVLIENLREGAFSYSQFYAQRAKRLLPALFITLVFTTLFFLYTVPQWRLAEFYRGYISSLLFFKI